MQEGQLDVQFEGYQSYWNYAEKKGLKERTVHRNGELISMTHREFATLVYLANHPSWVFSAGQIYEEVWGEDGENCGTAVASVIGQIRRKLTPDMPKAGYIRTVLGSGYKFEVPQGMAE